MVVLYYGITPATVKLYIVIIVVICLWQSYPMAGKGLMILNTEPTTLSKYKI